MPHDILIEADLLVNGDRAASYGSAQESFERIAALWSVLLAVRVEPIDVARCMIAMKLSRSMTSDSKDNWVDTAGYAQLAANLKPL